MTQHIGPSQFSHPFGREDMLETELTHDPQNFSEESCTMEDRARLIRSYLIAVSLILCQFWIVFRSLMELHRQVDSYIWDASFLRIFLVLMSPRLTVKIKRLLSTT